MTVSSYLYPSSYGGAEQVPGGPAFGGNANFVGTNPFTVQAQGGNTLVTFDSSNPNQVVTTFFYGTPQAYTETLVITQFNNSSYVETSDGTNNYILANDPLVLGMSYNVSPGTAFQLNPAFQTTTPCFASGTLIRTERGNIAVEALRLGDLAATASGALRAVRWLGHRMIDCRRHPRPSETSPICISAHAFGTGKPNADLYVSPGHAICVAVVGEVLIPASALVNGATIKQVEAETVTYWHVELEGGHDIIFANDLPAESYLDMGNRAFFAEDETVKLYASPDTDPTQRCHADFCRPFHDGGVIVEAVNAQTRSRATKLGWILSDALDMHLEVDGQRLDPVVCGMTARFHVPADAKDIWLVSPTARPCDTTGTRDDRELGLLVASLRIEDGLVAPRDIAVDDPVLGIGFHDVEDGVRRWTTGRARLPIALWESYHNGFDLRIDLAGRPVPRWMVPVQMKASLALAS